MKKSLLSIAVMTAFLSVNAQTYNYFDAADVDADGWLWFDTQEKIDKYCGWGSDYKIQLQSATFEDAEGQYAEPYGDPTVAGYNAEGVAGGEGAKTGAIVLPNSAKVSDAPNGGGFMLWLPDCAEFDVYMSAEYNGLTVGIKGAAGSHSESIDCATIKTYIDMGIFGKPLAKEYQYQWNNIQDLSNGVTGLTLKSEKGKKVTALFINNMTNPLYIHGIKVLTYTNAASAGIEDVDADAFTLKAVDGNIVASEEARISVYTTSGALVARGNGTTLSLEDLSNGIYVAKAVSANGTATLKVAL